MKISIALALVTLGVTVQAATSEHHGAGYYKKLSKALAAAGLKTTSGFATTTKASSTKTSATTKTSSTAVAQTPKPDAPSSGGPSCVFPSPAKTSSLSAPITVKKGQNFDGGNVRYDRGPGACSGQAEGGDSDAVFLLEEGASISNVIIGASQSEGIHGFGGNTLTNIWWEDVCEDAYTIKTQAAGQVTKVIGGGAKEASDKVFQHNGGGTLQISGFCATNIGKLYRSCGNCSSMTARHVEVSNSTVNGAKVICGINTNYGDTCSLKAIKQTSVKETCVEFKGNNKGDEPTKIKSGVNDQYCAISGI